MVKGGAVRMPANIPTVAGKPLCYADDRDREPEHVRMGVSLPAIYCLAVNLAAFGAFALDKRAAERGHRRIRERTLLLLAALGGAPGALVARQILRHKTQKQPFGLFLMLIVAGQIVLLALGLYVSLS